MFYGSCLICSSHFDSDSIFCEKCSRFALELVRKCCRCGGFSVVDGVNGCNLCAGRKIEFDSIFSPYIYSGSVSHVISIMKYGKNRHYASIIGDHFADLLKNKKLSPKTVVFPPMGFIDKLKRTFNQSEIIAEKVALKYHLELERNIIKKTRHTKPQASLTYDKRLKNLEGAFQIRKNVKEKNFLLVDDVCTTFSTINTIAELLKKNGARRVDVVTFARTSPYFG